MKFHFLPLTAKNTFVVIMAIKIQLWGHLALSSQQVLSVKQSLSNCAQLWLHLLQVIRHMDMWTEHTQTEQLRSTPVLSPTGYRSSYTRLGHESRDCKYGNVAQCRVHVFYDGVLIVSILSFSLFRHPLRFVMERVGVIITRIFLFGFGFQWISFKGRSVDPKVAPISIVVPHSSMLDIFVLLLDGLPCFLARESVRDVFLFGRQFNNAYMVTSFRCEVSRLFFNERLWTRYLRWHRFIACNWTLAKHFIGLAFSLVSESALLRFLLHPHR